VSINISEQHELSTRCPDIDATLNSETSYMASTVFVVVFIIIPNVPD